MKLKVRTIMLNENIVTEIEKNYHITVTHMSTLRESSDNYVYLLESRNIKYVLRMSKRDIQNDVIFETTWLDFLLKQGIPVVEVVPTIDKKLFTVFNNTALVLFNFANGQHITISPDQKPDLIKVENASNILAKIHNVSYGMNINIPRVRTIMTEIERALLLKNKFIENTAEGNYFVSNLFFYKTWGEKNSVNNYLLHNDYRTGNILFSGNKVTAILDFDWSCKGPAIKDVAHSLVEWSFPDGAEKHWKDVFDIFLKGYNKEARQKININETLYHWLCFSCLSDAATFFTDLANENTYMGISKSYMYRKFLYFKELLK